MFPLQFKILQQTAGLNFANGITKYSKLGKRNIKKIVGYQKLYMPKIFHDLCENPPILYKKLTDHQNYLHSKLQHPYAMHCKRL